MPIYEYRCNKCKSRFEKLVRLGSRDGITCSSCESLDIERIISKVSFISIGSSGEITRSSSSGCNTCSATTCAGCG